MFAYVKIESLCHLKQIGIPAPTNVKAAVLTCNSVEVTWDQSPDVIGYLISCTSTASYAGGKSVIVNGGDKTSHAFTDLIENTPYNITVQGLTSDSRKSEHSTEVLLTTQIAGKWSVTSYRNVSYI